MARSQAGLTLEPSRGFAGTVDGTVGGLNVLPIVNVSPCGETGACNRGRRCRWATPLTDPLAPPGDRWFPSYPPALTSSVRLPSTQLPVGPSAPGGPVSAEVLLYQVP